MVLFSPLLIVISLTCTIGAIRRMLYEKGARWILGPHNQNFISLPFIFLLKLMKTDVFGDLNGRQLV